MAPVVSQQTASPSVPEAHDAIQAASVNHGGACLPQQLHNARLHQGATSRVEVRGGRDERHLLPTPMEEGEYRGREGGWATEKDQTGARSGVDAPKDLGFPKTMAMAVARGCLYLVLTLVPKGLRRQVIDGQGPIQVADSCQRHPG